MDATVRGRVAARWLALRIVAPALAWSFALLAGVNSALAAGESALSALAALPAEERANLARIEGPEGTPRPERWYFDVFAADSETGLREYAVTGHQIVARRELSQFASNLTAEDVLESRFLRTDSTEIEKLAKEYATANNQVIAFLSLTLAKPFREARPVWTARCYDERGAQFGCLIVAAENGTVFAHEGFAQEPSRLSPLMEIASAPKTEQSSRHTRHPSPQRTPVERLAQRPPSAAQSKGVPPPPAATRPAHRPWWNLFGH